MSSFPSTANPIFYAQFHLRGGWKNTLVVAGVYGLVIGGVIWATAAASGGQSGSTLSGWTSGLLVLQLILLLIYGTFRVSSAVRSDVTGKIIESHRLMPLSPFGAIVGYVTGAPAQAISLAIVNLLLGIITTAATTGDLPRWFLANAMLAAMALMVWTITAQIAFSAKGGFLLLLIMMLAATANGGDNLALLPGLDVLTCPLVGRSIFDPRATSGGLTFPYAAALISQFIIGAIAFVACMRKYRMPDAIGLTDALGVILVAAWVAISAVGIRFVEEFHPISIYYRGHNTAPQFVASIMTALLLSIIPLSSAARMAAAWHRNGGPTPTQPRRPLPMLLTPLVAAVVVCLLLLVHPSLEPNLLLIHAAQTALVALAFMLGMVLLFRWVYQAVSRAWLIAIIWLALTWIVPLLADVLYRAITNDNANSLGMIASISPIGALSMIWDQGRVNLFPAIGIQFALVLLPGLLLLATHKKQGIRGQ
jgi:hypothetical protein